VEVMGVVGAVGDVEVVIESVTNRSAREGKYLLSGPPSGPSPESRKEKGAERK
jgi:hypothetical protein